MKFLPRTIRQLVLAAAGAGHSAGSLVRSGQIVGVTQGDHVRAAQKDERFESLVAAMDAALHEPRERGRLFRMMRLWYVAKGEAMRDQLRRLGILDAAEIESAMRSILRVFLAGYLDAYLNVDADRGSAFASVASETDALIAIWRRSVDPAA